MKCGSWDLPSEYAQVYSSKENREASGRFLHVILSCKSMCSVSVILSYRHRLWIMNWKESESSTPERLRLSLFCCLSSAVLSAEVPVNLLNLLPSSRANSIWAWTLHMLFLLTNHPVKDSLLGKDFHWSAKKDPISPWPCFSSGPLDCYCTCWRFDCISVGNDLILISHFITMTR